MELRVQLKVCEGCGCLWYRAHNHKTVYCLNCEVRLSDFPAPESRRRRGRPSRKPVMRALSLADAVGGAK